MKKNLFSSCIDIIYQDEICFTCALTIETLYTEFNIIGIDYSDDYTYINDIKTMCPLLDYIYNNLPSGVIPLNENLKRDYGVIISMMGDIVFITFVKKEVLENCDDFEFDGFMQEEVQEKNVLTAIICNSFAASKTCCNLLRKYNINSADLIKQSSECYIVIINDDLPLEIRQKLALILTNEYGFWYYDSNDVPMIRALAEEHNQYLIRKDAIKLFIEKP